MKTAQPDRRKQGQFYLLQAERTPLSLFSFASMLLQKLWPELPQLLLIKQRALADALVEGGLIWRGSRRLPVLTRRHAPLHPALKRLQLPRDCLLVARDGRPALNQAVFFMTR